MEGTNNICQHVTILENRLLVSGVECFFHVFRFRQQDLIFSDVFARNEENTRLIDICDALPSWRRTLGDAFTHAAQPLLHPSLTALGEDGLQMAFKQSTGVLEVLFGVGFGDGDAVKRFVEDANDALLFGERWMADMKRLDLGEVDRLMNRPAREAENILPFGYQEVLKEVGT